MLYTVYTHSGQPPNAWGDQVMVAAMRADAAAAAGWFEEFRESENDTRYLQLAMYAWLGDRDAANRLAAEFDSGPMGPLVLSSTLEWCNCGAPWDLEVTPVFAGKLREAGLEWPSLEPLKFPLKDW